MFDLPARIFNVNLNLKSSGENMKIVYWKPNYLCMRQEVD